MIGNGYTKEKEDFLVEWPVIGKSDHIWWEIKVLPWWLRW